jgi:hypothetical protein
VNRRVLGRGRALATIGAIGLLIACVLPWYTAGGARFELPVTTRNAFDGAGILVFIAAVAIIALVLLPYAAGDQPLAVDRALGFAIAAGLGIVGLVLKVVQQLGYGESSGMYPDRAPGLWLAGVALAIVVWGVSEIAAKRDR